MNDEVAEQVRIAGASRRPHKSLIRKVKMLVAVSPPALFQIIEYLFRGLPEFEIVSSPFGTKDMGCQAGCLRPELIVVNVKPLRSGICQTVQSLKRQNPRSKLILICPVGGFAPSARSCGADACLEAEALVGRLQATAQRLARASQAELLLSEKRKL